MSLDSDVTLEGVDDQLNVDAPGTVADDWGERAYSSWYSMVCLSNNRILTLVVTSESDEPGLSGYLSAAVTRLQDVMSG